MQKAEETLKVKTLEAEKINIVEKDGTVKMALFNSDNIPPLMMDGKDILPGHRQAEYPGQKQAADEH